MPRPIDGDSVPGAVCDTGAYELVAQPAPFTRTASSELTTEGLIPWGEGIGRFQVNHRGP